jgi:glycosyltransferase involved in cell wall biosynthesis
MRDHSPISPAQPESGAAGEVPSMRIALVHNLMSGGAKRTLTEATRRLAGRHHVDEFTLTGSEHGFADIRPYIAGHTEFLFEPLPLLQSPFGRINQLMRRADLSRLNRLARTTARRIEDGGYDVVLVHPCQFEQAPSVLKYLTRVPTVYYCHEPRRSVHEAPPPRPYDDDANARRKLLNRLDPFPGMYQRALRAVDRVNTRSAKTVLVNSRFTADAVDRIYGISAQISYHGVDADLFQPTGAEKGDFILSVGSLTPLKGFDFLIRAIAAYDGPARPPLVVVSNFQNPEERRFLQQLAADLGVDLRLRAGVSDTDLVRFYNEAKLVVYSPIREPFGLVPLEAMACATPIVAVAEGGIPESVVDGETGRLVERDARAFAAAIRELVDNPLLARQYGTNGRARVLERWTWDRAVSTLEGHLNDAIGQQSYGAAAAPALAR